MINWANFILSNSSKRPSMNDEKFSTWKTEVEQSINSTPSPLSLSYASTTKDSNPSSLCLSYPSTLKAFNKAENNEEYFPTDVEEYPKLTFLGTSSQKPSLFRNVSCILVEVW